MGTTTLERAIRDEMAFAHADQGQPARRSPLRGVLELAVAEFDTALLVRPGGVRLGQRHRHVEVSGAGGAGRGEQRHHEPRVGRVEQHVTTGPGEQRGDGAGIGGVHPLSGEPRVADRGHRRFGAAQVVVGHHHGVEERAPGGDPGDRRADTARTHAAIVDRAVDLVLETAKELLTDEAYASIDDAK